MIESMAPAIFMAGFGFAAIAATLMATLRMWQGWLDLKRAELDRRAPARGEERVEIAELRARVRQLEAIAACVDL
jgi:hypothetical protein